MRVAIIEDTPFINQTKSVLRDYAEKNNKELEIVKTFNDPKNSHSDFLNYLNHIGKIPVEKHPEIILLDAAPHSGRTLEFNSCRNVAQQIFDNETLNATVIVLSFHADKSELFSAVHGLVTGYIHKDELTIALPDAIKWLHEKKGVWYGSKPKYNEWYQNAIHNQSQRIKLTNRQKEILKLIIKGYRPSKIAEELNITSGAVTQNKRTIFNELSAHSVLGEKLRKEVLDLQLETAIYKMFSELKNRIFAQLD